MFVSQIHVRSPGPIFRKKLIYTEFPDFLVLLKCSIVSCPPGFPGSHLALRAFPPLNLFINMLHFSSALKLKLTLMIYLFNYDH